MLEQNTEKWHQSTELWNIDVGNAPSVYSSQSDEKEQERNIQSAALDPVIDESQSSSGIPTARLDSVSTTDTDCRTMMGSDSSSFEHRTRSHSIAATPKNVHYSQSMEVQTTGTEGMMVLQPPNMSNMTPEQFKEMQEKQWTQYLQWQNWQQTQKEKGDENTTNPEGCGEVQFIEEKKNMEGSTGMAAPLESPTSKEGDKVVRRRRFEDFDRSKRRRHTMSEVGKRKAPGHAALLGLMTEEQMENFRLQQMSKRQQKRSRTVEMDVETVQTLKRLFDSALSGPDAKPMSSETTQSENNDELKRELAILRASMKKLLTAQPEKASEISEMWGRDHDFLRKIEYSQLEKSMTSHQVPYDNSAFAMSRWDSLQPGTINYQQPVLNPYAVDISCNQTIAGQLSASDYQMQHQLPHNHVTGEGGQHTSRNQHVNTVINPHSMYPPQSLAAYHQMPNAQFPFYQEPTTNNLVSHQYPIGSEPEAVRPKLNQGMIYNTMGQTTAPQMFNACTGTYQPPRRPVEPLTKGFNHDANSLYDGMRNVVNTPWTPTGRDVSGMNLSAELPMSSSEMENFFTGNTYSNSSEAEQQSQSNVVNVETPRMSSPSNMELGSQSNDNDGSRETKTELENDKKGSVLWDLVTTMDTLEEVSATMRIGRQKELPTLRAEDMDDIDQLTGPSPLDDVRIQLSREECELIQSLRDPNLNRS